MHVMKTVLRGRSLKLQMTAASFIITADRGSLRAYRVEETPTRAALGTGAGFGSHRCHQRGEHAPPRTVG